MLRANADSSLCVKFTGNLQYMLLNMQKKATASEHNALRPSDVLLQRVLLYFSVYSKTTNGSVAVRLVEDDNK